MVGQTLDWYRVGCCPGSRDMTVFPVTKTIRPVGRGSLPKDTAIPGSDQSQGR